MEREHRKRASNCRGTLPIESLDALRQKAQQRRLANGGARITAKLYDCDLAKHAAEQR